MLSNLRLLNNQLQGLCRDPTSFDALHVFYSEKIKAQLIMLEWFEKFDRTATSADPIMPNSVDRGKKPTDLLAKA